jgi:hypothetical protein
VQLQAGCAPDRFILIPFLDERHDPVALPQRQSIPPSQIARLRNRVKRKMRAYHAFIQAGVVAQGLLQYLAIAAPKLVWSSFGSWLPCKKRFPHEFHRRAAGHAKHANFPLVPNDPKTDITDSVYTGDSTHLQYAVVDNNTVEFMVTLDEPVGNFSVGRIGLFHDNGAGGHILFSITALD